MSVIIRKDKKHAFIRRKRTDTPQPAHPLGVIVCDAQSKLPSPYSHAYIFLFFSLLVPKNSERGEQRNNNQQKNYFHTHILIVV